MDAVVAIQEHIDIAGSWKSPAAEQTTNPLPEEKAGDSYDDLLALDGLSEEKKDEESSALASAPREPEKDLLKFLLEYSTVLNPWQREIVEGNIKSSRTNEKPGVRPGRT